MNDRERWTVYPLLILSLGIALRSSGKFGPTKMISCERLHVATPDGHAGVDVIALPNGGIIQVTGANGRPQFLIESSDHGGRVATLAPNGHPLISLEPTQIGGLLTVFGSNGTAQHILGVPANQIESPAAEPPVQTTNPGDAEPKPADRQPADPQQPATDKPEDGKPGDAKPDAAEPESPRGDADAKPAEPANESPTPAEKKPAVDAAPEEKTKQPG